MSKTRIDFTDAQRAAIYARDRATCCFSGANLWLLDSPLRPGYERDWADHVRPSARGGSSDESNGVCASHTFNGKKRHNSADTAYLFERGLPTWRYFDIFGHLTPVQTARLDRLSRLTPKDWYLNRAVGQVLLGFDYRCRLERYKKQPQRDDRYWFRAAYRKVMEHQTFDTGPSLEDRGIVAEPGATVLLWNDMMTAESERSFLLTVEPHHSIYHANFLVWTRYFYDSESDAEKRQALHYAEKARGLTDDTLRCIQQDYALRTQRR